MQMQNDQKQNRPLFFNIVMIVCMAFSVAFGLSACKPKSQETALSFETIEKAEWGIAKLNESREPGMIIIARIDEINSLDGMTSGDSIKQLEALDYDQYFALAAFQGRKPGTAYDITVNRIDRIGNTVNIYAEFHEPKPNEASGALETSPYHLVKVQKNDSWNQGITFNLFSGQTLVASLTHTIP
jgi:hypothetical protein